MITIVQQPTLTFSACFTPIAFTLTSTNSTQYQFNFVCDVFHWPSGVKTLIGRLRAPAINGVGLFDISGLVSSTMNPVPSLTHGFTDETSFYSQWSVDFYEEYDTTGGVGYPTINIPSLVSVGDVDALQDAMYCWYASDDSLSGQVGNQDFKFLITHPRDKSQLHSSKIGITVRMDERIPLMWLAANSGTLQRRVKVVAYSIDGTLLFQKVFTTSPGFIAQPGVRSFGAGPIQLNELAADESEAFPIINNEVEYYTIQLYNSSGTVTASELLRFNIDRRPVKPGTRRVFWLNRFGGIDSMSFGYSENYTAERKDYNVGNWQLKGTAYSSQDPLVTIASSKISAEFSSNLMTERGYNSLKGLAVSPRIWINEPKRVWRSIAFEGTDGQAQLCDDDFDVINRGDDSLTGTDWYWIQSGHTAYEDSGAWAVIDATGTPTAGGYVDITGVPANSCIYEMGWSSSDLKRIAAKDLNWTRAKDNLRAFTFKADMPVKDSAWR